VLTRNVHVSTFYRSLPLDFLFSHSMPGAGHKVHRKEPDRELRAGFVKNGAPTDKCDGRTPDKRRPAVCPLDETLWRHASMSSFISSSAAEAHIRSNVELLESKRERTGDSQKIVRDSRLSAILCRLSNSTGSDSSILELGRRGQP
jgi:hypothetical protein